MIGRSLMARSGFTALSLTCAIACGQSSAPVDTSNSGAAATASDAAERCHERRASVDACDDAIRWNPRDPSLLAAMGDAQMRARRPADALRAYQRAAAIAPATPGIQQKITKTEAILAKSKSPTAHALVTASAGSKRFSNADPETQSH
jgi:cytochrome c-type biogenesis protein CcmH/NrfG